MVKLTEGNAAILPMPDRPSRRDFQPTQAAKLPPRQIRTPDRVEVCSLR